MSEFKIGHISKPHGYKGELAVWLELDAPQFIEDLGFLFIERGGSMLPYKIEFHSHKKGNVYRVKLQGVSDEKSAKALVKKDIYIPQDIADQIAVGIQAVDTIIGFKVIDSVKGEIGVVDQLSSPTSNPLIHIKINFSEVMIPFVDEVVKKVDHEAQTIHVTCPEGLLDLYLD